MRYESDITGVSERSHRRVRTEVPGRACGHIHGPFAGDHPGESRPCQVELGSDIPKDVSLHVRVTQGHSPVICQRQTTALGQGTAPDHQLTAIEGQTARS